jgi:hypothetical protein
MTSFTDYAECRRAGVGLDIVVTSLQWLHSLAIPPSTWEHDAMKDLMDEVAVGVFLFNDVVSLKKEVVERCRLHDPNFGVESEHICSSGRR